MIETELNTTCDIYKREIERLRASGDNASICEMISTWYSRCEFENVVDPCKLVDVGVRDNATVWFRTTRGTIEFCQNRGRWRLVEYGSEPIYMMARIAEITQVPFAYLCGIRDAVIAVESSKSEGLSDRLRHLRQQDRDISQQLRRKRIAVDAVAISVPERGSGTAVCGSRYPDAPAATLTWSQVRDHYRRTPGVYFAWSRSKIVYVGATEIGMHSRLQSGHHAVTSKDTFSFVEIPANEVYFAETCYVARYAPERNAVVAQANGTRKGGHRGKRKQRSAAAVCMGQANHTSK